MKWIKGRELSPKKIEARLVRKWINQPSTLQPCHSLHGTPILYNEKDRIGYFLSGPVISQTFLPEMLSNGWKL